MPASAPTSQGGIKYLVGGCLGVEEEMVEEAKVVERVGELALYFLNTGSSSSWEGDSTSGCPPQDPSIKLKRYFALHNL